MQPVSGISIGIDDLEIPERKAEIIERLKMKLKKLKINMLLVW